MIGWLYELVTGRPWLTVRSMAEEFGPPPAVYFAEEIAGLSDAELYAGPQRRAPRHPAPTSPGAGSLMSVSHRAR